MSYFIRHTSRGVICTSFWYGRTGLKIVLALWDSGTDAKIEIWKKIILVHLAITECNLSALALRGSVFSATRRHDEHRARGMPSSLPRVIHMYLEYERRVRLTHAKHLFFHRKVYKLPAEHRWSKTSTCKQRERCLLRQVAGTDGGSIYAL